MFDYALTKRSRSVWRADICSWRTDSSSGDKFCEDSRDSDSDNRKSIRSKAPLLYMSRDSTSTKDTASAIRTTKTNIQRSGCELPEKSLYESLSFIATACSSEFTICFRMMAWILRSCVSSNALSSISQLREINPSESIKQVEALCSLATTYAATCRSKTPRDSWVLANESSNPSIPVMEKASMISRCLKAILKQLLFM